MSPMRPRCWRRRARCAPRSMARRCRPRQQCRHCGRRPCARTRRRPIPPPDGGQFHRACYRHPGFRPAARLRSGPEGAEGRIVMISSVAGKHGNPLTSAYSASKHAIEGLSESLRRELMLFGIDVIVVAPGAVKTPIWARPSRSTFPLPELAVFPGAPESPRRHAEPWLDRIAGRDHRREGISGADAAESQSALYAGARPDAAIDGEAVAQADLRPRHRQAPRPDAAGMSTRAENGRRRGDGNNRQDQCGADRPRQ